MAGTRTTIGGVAGIREQSRNPGTPTGMGVNTFALGEIKKSLRGSQLIKILRRALRPAKEMACMDWPKLTGASSDSIRIVDSEVGETQARVSLVVGGQPLIDDPRNKSHKNYAPFIEFNGTSRAPAGIIQSSVYANEAQMKEIIAEGVRMILKGAGV